MENPAPPVPVDRFRPQSLVWLALTVMIFVVVLIARSQQPVSLDPITLERLGFVSLRDVVSIDDVELIDTEGHRVGTEVFSQKWSLVFFGFTSCPDICPTTMGVLRRVIAEMGTISPQVIFVSVDPERDTPEILRQYVQAFDPSIVALTGAMEKLKNFSHQMQTTFARSSEDEYYSVDHSANIALINPDGEFVGYFKIPHREEMIVKTLLAINGVKE